MRERILKNWNITRAVYVIIGIGVIVQSFMDNQWLGFAFGGYFASMGLFAFGCASGNCCGGVCETEVVKQSSDQEVVIKEIK